MRIECVKIENFRVFNDVTVKMNPYTCFVGPNGAGKSTVINALNVFFREPTSAKGIQALTEEDFHNKDTSKPIRITVTFGELSTEAEQDFKHYVRSSQLIVTAEATWNAAIQQAEVCQYGRRLGMAAFKPFFEACGDSTKKAPDIKAAYEDIRKLYPDLPLPAAKEKMKEYLQVYEADHPEDCEAIPSEDQFYGISKGQNLLQKHIQWIYVPAVKDASEEEMEGKNTALGKLLERTVQARTNLTDQVKELREKTLEEYQKILASNKGTLTDLGTALGKRMVEWAHPDVSLSLEWKQDPQKSVTVAGPYAGIVAGEGSFSGSLSRFGHGLQRSYLLAILHELADCERDGGPALILACEEPELYQHPPQIRHLASVFQRLVEKRNQIIVCTHSPSFVSGEGFEDVRLVRKDRSNGSSVITHRTFADISEAITRAQDGELFTRNAASTLAKINQALQTSLNEVFFAPVIILVEGLEDIAHITTYLMLMEKWDEFRRHGCHLVAANGKGHMIMPIAICRQLDVPIFTVFDADGDFEKEEHRRCHEKENKTLLRLSSSLEGPFPETTLWLDDLVLWPTNIGQTVDSEFDPELLVKVREEAHAHFGQTQGLKKNDLLIARKLTKAWEQGHKSASLLKLCQKILDFAERRGPLARIKD